MADALLSNLRETVLSLMAAKQSSSLVPAEARQQLSQCTAILMELKSQTCEASAVDVAVSGAGAVETSKRRVAEADDELRALKYQRGRLKRAIAECSEPSAGAGESSDAVLGQVISLDEASKVRQPPGLPGGASAIAGGGHQQMLYRLGVEHDERVRLRDERDRLLARKAALATAASQAVALKTQVDAQMETVTAAAEPLLATALTKAASRDEPFHPLAPLLPSPLYTLALTAASYFAAVEAEVTLSVIGDVAAAQSLAQAKPSGGGAGGGAELATAIDGRPEESATSIEGISAHPLSLVISMRQGATKVTFQYHPGLQLLAVAAEPQRADKALRTLYTQLPSAGKTDDGSVFPDLCSTLRWHRLAAACGKPDEAGVSVLAPYRPYKWVQWLGGLGPLLTAAPQPSHRVLEVMLKVLCE